MSAQLTPQRAMTRTAANGVPFACVIVRQGDRYGLDFCLVNEGETLVEFWDLRYGHGPIHEGAEIVGQFVARYLVPTLLDTDTWSTGRVGERAGLDLYGGEPSWKIDQATAAAFVAWIEEAVQPA
jgi:hypothetical protein